MNRKNLSQHRGTQQQTQMFVFKLDPNQLYLTMLSFASFKYNGCNDCKKLSDKHPRQMIHFKKKYKNVTEISTFN